MHHRRTRHWTGSWLQPHPSAILTTCYKCRIRNLMLSYYPFLGLWSEHFPRRSKQCNSTCICILPGTAVAQWLRCCATNRKVAGSIAAGVSGFFIDIKSFRSHYGPGVDSASNRMSIRSNSWGKGGRCVRLTTLPPSCAVVTKSGNLNFLEHSGPLRACNGTALPFISYLIQTTCGTQHKSQNG